MERPSKYLPVVKPRTKTACQLLDFLLFWRMDEFWARPTFLGLVPVETAGRQLDDDSWDRQEPALVAPAGTSDSPSAKPYSGLPSEA